MSYYFAIIGTGDNPLFEIDFGTSKGSGDGTSHFRKEARHMNQFIVHAALDSVDDVQWTTKELYVHSRKPPLFQLTGLSLTTCSKQISKEDRHFSEQSHPLSSDRRQHQVHAPDEPRSEQYSILGFPDFASLSAFHCPAEHNASEQS